MLQTREKSVARRLPIGAEVAADGAVHFRVWAPKRRRVELVLAQEPGKPEVLPIALKAGRQRLLFGAVRSAHAGMRHGFRLDRGQKIFPDPASRFQPEGPAGWSQIVDPASFKWTDGSWQGIGLAGQVLYEMHIGTFTPEGTFAAAARELPELKRIGITTIEVLPVADFPGRFGWGYDGVSMFAPTRLYGQPDDFRRFVDQAHAIGLGVILDVVYNHFGNIDNYLGEFSDNFRSHKYKNEWADAINFDDDRSRPVREFFTTNARYWIEEFHLDGFRFDAIHTIHDESQQHILAEVNQAARKAAAGRTIITIAEDEQENVRRRAGGRSGGAGI